MLNTNRIKNKFENLSNRELINYIFKRHHAFLKEELSKLREEVITLYEVYYNEEDNFLEKVHGMFNILYTNFESHMVKEEKALFTNIRDYEKKKDEEVLEKIMKEIESVEKNNNQIDYAIREIKRVTNDYTKETQNHSGYNHLYSKLKELELETEAHFELERDLLYKRLKKEMEN